MMLGQADGSHALHYLLEDPFAGDELSDAFLYAMMDQLSFAARRRCTRCCTRRVTPRGARPGGRRSGSGPSSPSSTRRGLDGDAPLYFTGEMIYPWMIDADPVLRPLRRGRRHPGRTG